MLLEQKFEESERGLEVEDPQVQILSNFKNIPYILLILVYLFPPMSNKDFFKQYRHVS